jgi:glycosyltransferase involved in cell wall biosynthesis
VIVAVVTEVEADSPRAHFINVVKTAGGFARMGHHVLLLCRAAAGGGDGGVAQRFAEPGLEVHTAPASTSVTPIDRAWTFARWAAAKAEQCGADFMFARSFCSAMAGADAGLATVMETHAHIGDGNPILQASLEATARARRPIAGLVTISHRLAEHYIARGAAAGRVHIVPDGVDVPLFTRPEQAEARGRSPTDENDGTLTILYSGHLYDEKGIPTVIDAAPIINTQVPARVHLLGGLPDDIERARSRAAKSAPGLVRIHGPVPHAQVPPWLWHADCLVLPPSGRDPSANWTSPVKLGEYLAAGPPIVASSIPALRDWLDERTVRWFRPDDPADLARAVLEAMRESPEDAATRQAHAKELAARFSYPARARAILRAGGAGAATPGVGSSAAAS